MMVDCGSRVGNDFLYGQDSVGGGRWEVERWFQEARDYVGMLTSWHARDEAPNLI